MRTGAWMAAALTAAWLATACGGGPVYYEYRATGGGWRPADTLAFEAGLPDTGSVCLTLWLEVRHRDDYPYRNLALRLKRTVQTAADTLVQADTLRLVLADSHGRRTGSGLANLFTVALPAATFCTSTPAHLRFAVTPALPDSLLQGISDIGLRLEPAVSANGARGPRPSAETQTAEW